MWHLCTTTEHDSVLRRKDSLTPAVMWMNREDSIMRSDVDQSQKDR